jgi:hypothetical protein
MSLVEDFAELFEGRKDAYGTEEGGCKRLGEDAAPAAAATWHFLVERHLQGLEPLGVYPMVQHPVVDKDIDYGFPVEWCVKWGCVDLDVKREGKSRYDYETEEDAHQAARNLVTALEVLGTTGWIERTRSGGRHVWVFATGWTVAQYMRRALLVACQVADVPPTEVNPKQETLAEGALGNYVRLPYPGGWEDDGSRYIYPPPRPESEYKGGWFSISREGFVERALAARSEPHVYKAAADLYVPPKPPVAVHVAPSAMHSDITRRLNGLAFTIWRDGPAPGVSDRSRTLFTLAAACRDSGLAPTEAYGVVEDLDARIGKFVGRNDREKQLTRIIERAYQ